MKKNVLVLVVIVSFILLTGCSGHSYAQNTKTEVVVVSSTELVKDRLYYITHKYAESDFSVKYEKFIKEHPNLEITGGMPDVNDGPHDNSALGYFIFTKRVEIK